MRKVILSANIGGFDEQHISQPQLGWEHFILTDQTFPYPMPVLSNRMKAQFPRMMAHRFIPEMEMMIWHDASIFLIREEVGEVFSHMIDDADILILRHPQRETIGEEMNFIRDLMEKGNPYLSSRYSLDIFEKEFSHYTSKGIPLTLPLYATGFFCRRVNEKTNRMFEEWWMQNQLFSGFDQILFSVVASKFPDVKIKSISFDTIIGRLAIRSKHQTK